MKFDMNSLLKDQNVLRIIALVSVFNLLGYLMMQNLDAVAFFIIIGFLTTYFSKNMIIVLLVSMIATNFLVMSRAVGKKTIEGMTDGKEEEEEKKEEEEEDSDKPKVPPAKPVSEKVENKMTNNPDTKLDHPATVEKAYEHLESMIGSGGIEGMTKETDRLVERQKKLAHLMEGMPKMMGQVEGMLNKVGGLEGLTGAIEQMQPLMNIVGNLTGGSSKKKEGQEGFALM